MRRRSLLALGLVAALIDACGLVPGLPSAEETAFEGMPGPGSYLVTTEPVEAFESRAVALMLHGETVIHLAELDRGESPEHNFGASLLTIRGRPYVKGLINAWPGTTLEASVEGARCHGTIEFTEDDEVDATIVIGEDGCELRLDRRHEMGAMAHPAVAEPSD